MTTQLTIVQRPTRLLVARVGVQGPRGVGGTGGASISPTAGNLLEVAPDGGLLVAPLLATKDW